VLLSLLLGAGTLLLTPLVLRAQGEGVAATECCLPLLVPVGARSVGLASTLTARAGADGMLINPASLAGVARDEFRIHSARTEVETATTFGLSLRIRNAGTVGVLYRLVDYGDIDATDDFGNVIGTLRLLEQVLHATFATNMSEELRAGISYKLFQFRQDCTNVCGANPFSATTHGIDAGVQFHPRVWPSLQLGVAVVHLGFPLQVVNAEQASPMPARLRAGAAYELMHHFTTDSAATVWASVDVAASWREGVDPVVAAAIEAVLDETLFLRGGYSTGTGRTAGAAIGIGLRYDRFDVGVAKTFADVGGSTPDPFQITFAIAF
jgi:hypothetical protein